jgi:class 3 adenylate cyclase
MAAEGARERRIVSVLFADLVGFTTLAVDLDSEDVASVQDAYFAAVRETVGRYGGRLEKFIGDAAMAVFGVPRARDDDAERAVRAGLALTSAVEQLGARLGLEQRALRLRVGVNSGEVVHHEAAEGRVTWDTVNVAARFQTAAPPGGVLVGEATALAVADAVELDATGPLELKGKAERVKAWQATRLRPEPSLDFAMGRLRAPLTGRDDELGRLRQAFAGGGGRITRLAVVAPPGVGKTRLVEEFARLAADDEEPPLVWRARLRPELLSPYKAIGQLILGALADAGCATDVPAARDLIRGRVGRLGFRSARAQVVEERLLDAVWPSGDDDTATIEDREALFDVWLTGLEALAGGRRALWIVEDVHWSAATCSRSSTRPQTGLPEHRRWCWRRPGRRCWSECPIGAALLEVCCTSRRSPSAMPARSSASSSATPCRPVSSTPSSIAPTETLFSSRSCFGRGSAWARRFPIGALEPLGISHHRPAIEVLRTRALIAEPRPDSLVGDTYVYRHALLRDAGYASLARAERAALHVRLARWLEAVAAERPADLAEVVARHYAAALERHRRSPPKWATDSTARAHARSPQPGSSAQPGRLSPAPPTRQRGR